MDYKLDYEIQKILKNAEKEMMDLRHPYVGSEHLLLSLLKKDNINSITKKYGLTYDKFKNKLKEIVGMASKKSEVVLYTPLLRMIINDSINNDNITDIDLFKTILNSEEGIALRILEIMEINIDDMYLEFENKEIDITEFGSYIDCNNTLIGRDNEINNIIEILLRKNKNNPILIGEAGVGKSAIVYELARRIKNGDVPDKLINSKIINIDMAGLLSNTKYRGEFETKLNNLINKVSNSNIILFIDEIHTIVKSGGGEGCIDASNILKPYLANGSIKLIGATTINEYDTYISCDKALSRRFTTVNICEPNEEETLNILKGIKSDYEKFHNVKINNELLKEIVSLSNKYILNNHNPDKSIEVLDCVLSRVSLNNNREYDGILKIKNSVNINDIKSVIEDLTGIKLLSNNDYKRLVNKLNIINQDTSLLKKYLKNKFNKDGVLGILIKGENHTGKSSTAKIIANELKYNLIDLDMMEYSSSTSINRIIGADAGYIGYDDKCLLDKIKYHPYSLLLIRNIECASPNIINLFKTILNKGYIKDRKNNIVDFSNSLLIFTSTNINNDIGYSKSNSKEFIDNVVYYSKICYNSY